LKGHVDLIDEVRLEAAKSDRLDRSQNAGLMERGDRRLGQPAAPLRLGLTFEEPWPQLSRSTQQFRFRDAHRRTIASAPLVWNIELRGLIYPRHG
jgi:hypothetical protein